MGFNKLDLITLDLTQGLDVVLPKSETGVYPVELEKDGLRWKGCLSAGRLFPEAMSADNGTTWIAIEDSLLKAEGIPYTKSAEH